MWTTTRRQLLGSTIAIAMATVAGGALADEHLPEGGSIEAVANEGERLRIAFMAFQNNPFWVPVIEGAEAATAYLGEFNTTVDYIDLGDNLTPEAVIVGIEAAVAQGYDGIVTVPIFDGTERAINEAAEAGVPTINIIAEGSVPSDRILFIGQNATAAGAQLGAFMAEEMGGDGKLGVITGYFGAVQHTQRMNGAIDFLAENFPDIEIVGPFENQDRAELAYSQVQDMLTANPDIEMIYVTAGGPFGAARAVRDLDLTGTVGVVGFDHTPDNTAYIASGEMAGLIDQAPFQQAFDATVTMHNFLVTDEAPTEDVLFVDGNLLTADGIQN
ncbi:sugar ABC transporter substrate-binding protein [Yoonia sediminilitoris]|uniref:Ribose transport system substrate-binding protein n=1 Tax=Yoonia sediminilitoris TaxID=1286148 RepID=A0A2T6KAL9_9RHOB|nr:sugar ABC transporter substrate-binding protein [Yoonia sediminilitoris]PUB11883.1 ribose transport system substrate-binding protein [Yoonia sediminilitoris]RCW91960.1 ribose transport system substrate-binding protein [Yoonia sediminilitoris]